MELLVISSYPERGNTHGENTVGGASYTKATLQFIKRLKPDADITVLADIFDRTESYKEDGINVERVWCRGSTMSIFELIFSVMKNPAKIVMISFEGYMFGGIMQTAVFLSALPFWRMLGKKPYTVVHQVIDDFSDIEKSSFKSGILNLLKKILYQHIIFFSYKTIVFERQLKRDLGNSPKIIVIPHAVPTVKQIDQITARKKLGLESDQHYALYFGFLSPYKGTDRLVDVWPEKTDWQLIIAGGPNKNHLENKQHRQFVTNLLDRAKEKKILTTGFVKEEDIDAYFSAADVVIFPYRVFMSSSGPLAFALAHHKPFLLSDNLAGYFESQDFRDVLAQSNLKVEDFLCDMTGEDLQNKLLAVKTRAEDYRAFSALMAGERSWERIGKQYEKLF